MGAWVTQGAGVTVVNSGQKHCESVVDNVVVVTVKIGGQMVVGARVVVVGAMVVGFVVVVGALVVVGDTG